MQFKNLALYNTLQNIIYVLYIIKHNLFYHTLLKILGLNDYCPQ